MLSISDPLLASAADYYVNYYKKHGKSEGVFFGRAVEKLSLGLRVKDPVFRSLLNGFHPRTGQALVQNSGRPNRQGAWDLTFSAPKSVSVLWSLLPRKLRRLIEKAHTEAVKDALNLLQEKAGFTRR